MEYRELVEVLRNVGQDPSRLLFEDELTGIHNRRFLLGYLEHKVRWGSLEDFPQSLLMLDVDNFKQINDQHGHDAGDQALCWLAALLREVAGKRGIPARYAGDEFAVLLPKADAHEARELAEQLLARTRERPFRLRDSGAAVPITVSLGLATAPADARSPRDLLQRADVALYQAKRSGRNRAATTAEVEPANVAGRSALQRLEARGLVGREAPLLAVTEVVGALGERSSFLILEGGPGMGKTALLETLHGRLSSDPTLRVVSAKGVPQEGFRPYYMALQLVSALLREREERGEPPLRAVTEREAARLRFLLPDAGGGGVAAAPAEADRADLFNALVRLLRRLAGGHSLVLLLDDLQAADEATLQLLRVLVQRREVPVAVVATTLVHLGDEDEITPLELFCERHKEFEIRRVTLGPLGAEDIRAHLEGAFPGLRLPADFADELAETSQGNPLFLAELVRKLIDDRRLLAVGEAWTVDRPGEGYLPRSLEEIVRREIAALDEEARQLLARASTLGEKLPLSVLTGVSDLQEGRILELLDRAQALGLVHLDFQINDETMRFLGKRIHDITYGEIEPGRRRALHDQVAGYQERLYLKRLLPSASLLAYHFKRAANLEKATRYEQLQRAQNQLLFDPQEAAGYAGELDDEEASDEPLDADGLRAVPLLLRTTLMAVRAVQLYPPESQSIVRAQQQVKQILDQVLTTNARLTLAQTGKVLLANGQRLDVTEYKVLAFSFMDLLARADLQAIAFMPGLAEAELGAVLRALGQLRPESLGPGHWRDLAAENAIEHIDLVQLHYSEVRRARPAGPSAPKVVEERPLEAADLQEVPRLLRALVGCVKSVRLYPVGSQPARQALQQLQDVLRVLLVRYSSLSLAGVHGSLLVNGQRPQLAEHEALVRGFLDFLDSVSLRTLTFLPAVNAAELEAFLATVRELPPGRAGTGQWEALARARGFQGLVFNRVQYGIGVLQSLLASDEAAAPAADGAGEAEAEARASTPATRREELREALPRYGKELLAKGELTVLWQLLGQLFESFEALGTDERLKTVAATRALIEDLSLAHQHPFAELAGDHMVAALAAEEEPRVLTEVAATLYPMASAAVRFSDYPLAARILSALKSRQRALEQGGQADTVLLAEILDRRLDAAAQKLLCDDLQSGDPNRQEKAAEVLGALGPASAPLLLDVIKQERDYRIRQLAAGLLAELGPEAARQARRELVLEVTAEQRFRLLEVIDTVTRELREEIAFCIGDVNPKVRKAAFRLAERLRDPELVPLLADFARRGDAALAKGSIRCIAKLHSGASVEQLVGLLASVTQPEIAVSCCQALGQLGDPAAVEALKEVLGSKRYLLFGRKWDDQVRATAALALFHIPHPNAVKALEPFLNDGDPRVRELATSATQRKPGEAQPPLLADHEDEGVGPIEEEGERW